MGQQSGSTTQSFASESGVQETVGGGGTNPPEVIQEVVGPPQCNADKLKAHRTEEGDFS